MPVAPELDSLILALRFHLPFESVCLQKTASITFRFSYIYGLEALLIVPEQLASREGINLA
jgi:hypothetical protein